MKFQVMHNRLGLVDSNIVALDSAVNEYDEKLLIDRAPGGEWAVHIRLERPHRPYPVFVLNEPLPTVPELIDKLRRTDSQRHDIRAQLNKANAAWEAELDRKTKEEVGKAAEVVEYLGRKEGVYQETQSRRRIRNN